MCLIYLQECRSDIPLHSRALCGQVLLKNTVCRQRRLCVQQLKSHYDREQTTRWEKEVNPQREFAFCGPTGLSGVSPVCLSSGHLILSDRSLIDQQLVSEVIAVESQRLCRLILGRITL